MLNCSIHERRWFFWSHNTVMLQALTSLNLHCIQLFQLTLSDQSFIKDILVAAATSSSWYPNISFIQMARHRRSSLNRRDIPDFDEFIHKKIIHSLEVLSCSFTLWPDNVNWNSCMFYACLPIFHAFSKPLLDTSFLKKPWCRVRPG